MQISSLNFIIAFVVVLGLIGLVAWSVRRFGGSRLGANASRGRMPRLAVIDAAAVDGRRRLVLVRRDNVEHLLMIGGPTDIVVEPNIIRAAPGREAMPPRASTSTSTSANVDLPPRPTPLPDVAGWSDAETRTDALETREPSSPELAPRSARPAFVDELRRPLPPVGERRGDTAQGMTPNQMARTDAVSEAGATPRPHRGEPALARQSRATEQPARALGSRAERTVASQSPPSTPATASGNTEQNLAEMAHRLEAALRRPGGSDRAEPRPGAPDTPPRSSQAPVSSRSEASAEATASPSPKTGFENLEDEMASLLGRPKNPS